MAKRVLKMAIRCLLFDRWMSTMHLQSSVCQRIGNTVSFFCQHSMHNFIKKGRSGPDVAKMTTVCLYMAAGPLFNSKSLCYSELSRILTCVFQSMMPHLHTLLGRQSRWLHYGYIMAIVRQHRLLADSRKPDKFANV